MNNITKDELFALLNLHQQKVHILLEKNIDSDESICSEIYQIILYR